MGTKNGKPKMDVQVWGTKRRKPRRRSLSGNEEMGEPRKSGNQEGLLVSIKKVSRLHMYLCVLAYAHI